MKNLSRKGLFLTLLSVLSLGNSFSQSAERPNAIAFGLEMIDYSAPLNSSFLNFEDLKATTSLTVSRYIRPAIDLGFELAFGTIYYPSISPSGYPDVVDDKFDIINWSSYNLLIKLKLNEGTVFSENSLVMPFLQLGLGFDNVANDWQTNIPLNGGFGLRINEKLKIQFRAGYRFNLDNSFDYVDHSAKVVFSFGQKSEPKVSMDQDQDGILDQDDSCPFLAGKPQFDGCPDTDEDGIPDNQDDCPLVFGTKNGCP